MTKKISFIIICIVAVIAIVVDIFLALDKIPGNTWSEVIIEWSYKLPLIPVSFGFISGHFFITGLPRRPFWIMLLILIGLIAIFQVLAIWLDVPAWIPFLISFPLGGIFWSMPKAKK